MGRDYFTMRLRGERKERERITQRRRDRRGSQRRGKNGTVLALDRKSPSFAQTAKDGAPSSSLVRRPNDENPRSGVTPTLDRRLLAGGFFIEGEAVVADAAYFGAGDGDLHFEVAGDLFF